jgi:hypothetical protein
MLQGIVRWMGTQLACFFVEHESREGRIVLVFNEANDFHPLL